MRGVWLWSVGAAIVLCGPGLSSAPGCNALISWSLMTPLTAAKSRADRSVALRAPRRFLLPLAITPPGRTGHNQSPLPALPRYAALLGYAPATLACRR